MEDEDFRIRCLRFGYGLVSGDNVRFTPLNGNHHNQVSSAANSKATATATIASHYEHALPPSKL
jgi:hypothetical protein